MGDGLWRFYACLWYSKEILIVYIGNKFVQGSTASAKAGYKDNLFSETNKISIKPK